MPAAFAQVRDRLDPAAVHDTVAAILRQPEFSHAARESLAGRAFRYLIARLFELFDRVHGSPVTRLFVLTAIVLIVIVIVGRIALSRAADAEAEEHGSGARPASQALADAWAAADALAREGRYTDACHRLYAAVLLELGRIGHIARHPSKTSGEYWREMRRAGASEATSFRAFASGFDRVIYGTGSASADDYAMLAQVARELVSGTRRAA